jgi:tagatose 1,6-diphosphate aldolase GatY/KbaY
MALIHTGKTLQEARRAGYCVGAFNIIDYLSLEAVIHAATACRSPVIIQTSPGTVKRYGAAVLVDLVQTLAVRTDIPIGLHLDHGVDRAQIRECIRAGYTSVMIDASMYPFAENVARTLEVVDEAHQEGVAVEGEIGVLAGIEDDFTVVSEQARYTTPDEAIAFQAATGVDFLAVAIGTAHGFYKTRPRLDIDTLQTITSLVDFPLVIHGGTGLDDETIRKLVISGGSKMNISTQLKKTYIDSMYEYIQANRDEYNPLRVVDQTHRCLVEMVSRYLRLFGSTGKV